jgi:hypothetical protein
MAADEDIAERLDREHAADLAARQEEVATAIAEASTE